MIALGVKLGYLVKMEKRGLLVKMAQNSNNESKRTRKNSSKW